jgi:glycosyltransferase involved in cell wall biosynthesis
MVEALAAGTPVLAVNRGGARDIVRPDRDGVLISGPIDPAAIARGVRALARREWEPQGLRQSAKRFSEDRFRERLGQIMRSHGAR